jgi:hypothetical protein
MTDHIIHSTDGQTYDLTTNRIVFGLLPKDVQDAMEAWPHGVQMYSYTGEWLEVHGPSWHNTFVYCAIPAPKVTEYVMYWSEGYYATPRRAGSDTHRIIIRDDGKGNLTATVEKL